MGQKKKKKKAARRTYAPAAGGANRPTAPATTTAAATSFHSGASSRSASPSTLSVAVGRGLLLRIWAGESVLGEAEREDAPEWQDVASAVVVADAVGRLSPADAEAYDFYFFISHIFDFL